MTSVVTPVFKWKSNNKSSTDTSGVATWEMRLYKYGKWQDEKLEVPFLSFRHAMIMDSVIEQIVKSAEQIGYQKCKRLILTNLEVKD